MSALKLRASGPRAAPHGLWGTDFPHIFRNIGYRAGMDLFRRHMPFLVAAEDRKWLFAKSALSIWRFGAATPVAGGQ